VNAGIVFRFISVPKGRPKFTFKPRHPCTRNIRPSLRDLLPFNPVPALKRRAILTLSLRDKFVVPEGRPTIAQRFNVGSRPNMGSVPKGRLTFTVPTDHNIQPSLRDARNSPRFPALKRRAIFAMSLRDKFVVP